MSFLANLFKRTADKRSDLEVFTDGLSSSSINAKVKNIREAIKVPYVQAMSVLLWAKSFTVALRSSAEVMPKIFKPTWPFGFDMILAECSAFYFYILMKDYLRKPNAKGEWADEDNIPDDPYFLSLKCAMSICDEMIHTISDRTIQKEFVANRVIAYSMAAEDETKNLVDEFSRLVLKAWIPEGIDQLSLDLSILSIAIQTNIVHMPIDPVILSCRDLYDVKVANPDAY